MSVELFQHYYNFNFSSNIIVLSMEICKDYCFTHENFQG
jgi:hypothetical protein